MHTVSFAGILQRLNIIEQTDRRLVLRERPLLDYLVGFALVVGALLVWIAGLRAIPGIALALALYFIVQGRVRLIVFDSDTGKMLIHYQTILKKEVASEINLNEIKRAYLFKGDDMATQIILVRVDAEEMGLSVYSNDINPWKDDIVIAINAILHEAHRDEN